MSVEITDESPLILFVDDESHLRVTVRDFLAHHGYRVELARSGEQALRKLQVCTPSLVILDISMPGMGGMGFLQRVQASAEPPPPILILTARINLRTFFDGVDVAGFIAKPCHKELLLEKIEAVLATTSRQARSEDASGSQHVLLGEDDPEMADRLSRALSRKGLRVTTAESGPAVLEVAPSQKPDVVVLKRYLTGLNGGPVASLLRAMPTTSSTPIVVYNTVGVGDRVESATIGAGSRDVNRYVVARDSADILDAIQLTLTSA
ncbi:MAG: response regulator [Verrucomicrobia bacterium]|nr:response regulator [Verrucomicrobiota bacterium]MBT7068762.1 response regulator [Verrucomicrobiota bacterium]MBT7698869.1 response regulator [Verrucomicrobiota bacterium]